MYQRRRSRVLLAVLVLAALTLVTVDFRGGVDGPLQTVRDAATNVFEPVQNLVATAVEPVGDAVKGVGDLFRLRSENRALRHRVEQLSARRESFGELERENDRLRDLLGMRDRIEADTVAAQVVALAPSNFEWTITVDVGRSDGVDVDMPVINGAGLVGRVIQVTEGAARVLLAIDPNFSAAVRDVSLGETGPIEGQGSDLMLYQPLDPEARLTVGDEVVTSSYRNGVFPPGIPVGTIDEIGEATTLLTRDVLVRPYVDFTRLEYVLIVQTRPVDPLPPTGSSPDGFDPPRLVPDETLAPPSSGRREGT